MSVKFYHIFYELKCVKGTWGYLTVDLPWKFFDKLINFKMAAFIFVRL